MKQQYEILRVPAGGDETEVLRFGNGKEAFVILPGLSVISVLQSAAAIAQQYEALTKRFTVYLIDRKKAPPAGYTTDDMAKDAALVLKALGLSRVALFGASQGGMIALIIAIRYPELVGRLMLGSAACRMDARRFSILDRWIALARQKDRVALYLDFGEAIYPPAVFEKYKSALIRLAGTVTDEDLARFVTLAEGTRGFDVTSDLKKIACPVLVLGAADDRVLGGEATDEIENGLRGVVPLRVHRYDGCGHAAFDTAEDYREKLLDFLAE